MFYLLRLYEVNRDRAYFRSTGTFWSYAHVYASFHDVRLRSERDLERQGRLDLSALTGLILHVIVYAIAVSLASRGGHWAVTAAAATWSSA